MPEKYHENEVEHFYISCKHRALVRVGGGGGANPSPKQPGIGGLEARTDIIKILLLAPLDQNPNVCIETSGVIAFESIL